MRQLRQGRFALLDGLSKRHLFRRAEKRYPTDLTQIHRRRRGDTGLGGICPQLGLEIVFFLDLGLFGAPAVRSYLVDRPDVVVSVTVSALLLALAIDVFKRTGEIDPDALAAMRG